MSMTFFVQKILSFSTFIDTASGKVLEETFHKWVQYKDDCIRMIENEPPPQDGLFCNRTFDRYACWPDTPAGALVNISCPFYLPWYDQGKTMMVSFRTLYTVGYSLSLLTLVTALVILLSLRKLHCTRNYIHANLFLSFILRAASVIVKDTMLERHWGREIMKPADVSEMLGHQAAIGCRIAQVLMQYCVLANHYWFFGEAIYLYSVLIASVLIDSHKYLLYICLGWGTPLLFVIPWVVMKILKENKECWAVNENMNYWWIIRSPILFASLVSMIFGTHRPSRHAFNSLAKATLTLMPLFGIHEVIFIFVTDEQTTGALRYLKVFFSLFLNSFQGFLVAVLYCYANKEVSFFSLLPIYFTNIYIYIYFLVVIPELPEVITEVADDPQPEQESPPSSRHSSQPSTPLPVVNEDDELSQLPEEPEDKVKLCQK
uniref:Glucagon receptor n=1 Tax=Hippocampus comes TaxID=109280 RepID=A0A3Q2Y516_HIPCM